MNPNFTDVIGSVTTKIADRFTDADKTFQYRATKKLRHQQRIESAVKIVSNSASVITIGAYGVLGLVKIKEALAS